MKKNASLKTFPNTAEALIKSVPGEADHVSELGAAPNPSLRHSRRDLVTKLRVTFIEHNTDHYGACIPSKRLWQGDQISVSINSERLKINRTGNGSLTQMRELSLSNLLQICSKVVRVCY